MSPCEINDYRYLNQGDRSEKYDGNLGKCDAQDLRDEWHFWYKVFGDAGNALASNNRPQGRCGTTARLYLKDNHPSVNDSEVTRTVCVAKGGAPCRRETSIQVINCGDFYLYKLVEFRECGTDPWRYCTNGEGEC